MISLDQLPADEKLKLIYILVFTSEFLYLSYSTRGFLFSRSSSPPKLFYERGKQSWLENWQEYSQETCCRLQLCRKRDFDTGFILNFVKLFGTTLLQNTFGQMHVDLLCFPYKASPLFSKHNLLTSDSCFSCSGSSMYIYIPHFVDILMSKLSPPPWFLRFLWNAKIAIWKTDFLPFLLFIIKLPCRH